MGRGWRTAGAESQGNPLLTECVYYNPLLLMSYTGDTFICARQQLYHVWDNRLLITVVKYITLLKPSQLNGGGE